MPSYQPGPAFSVTSPFGNRNGEFHPGLDFAAPAGTPVPAASDGTVVYSGYNQGPQGSDRGGYGYTVIIRSTGADGSTYYTLYAHMQPSDLPEVGKQVASGDIIGNVGNTGFVEGNNFGIHLHFEVLKGDTPVNNADGGPVGFSSTNQNIREDPNTFDQWNAGTPFQGGLNTSSSGGGDLGDIASSDGSLGEQRVVATANGVEVETLTFNSDGSQTENLQSLNADGSAQFALTASIPAGLTSTDQFTIGTVLDATLNAFFQFADLTNANQNTLPANVEVEFSSDSGFSADIGEDGTVDVTAGGTDGGSVDGVDVPPDSGSGGGDSGGDPLINGHSFIVTGDLTVIAGNGNNNLDLRGGAGSSTVIAGNGNDTIIGGSGHDVIIAGNGVPGLRRWGTMRCKTALAS